MMRAAAVAVTVSCTACTTYWLRGTVHEALRADRAPPTWASGASIRFA